MIPVGPGKLKEKTRGILRVHIVSVGGSCQRYEVHRSGLCSVTLYLGTSLGDCCEQHWIERMLRKKKKKVRSRCKNMGNKLPSSIIASDSWDWKCLKNVWLLSAEARRENLNTISGLFRYQMGQRAKQTVRYCTNKTHSHYLKSHYWIVWHLEIHLPVRTVILSMPKSLSLPKSYFWTFSTRQSLS